ncbi:MAG: hypothetical protein JO029_10995 [Candidatus Eremiobacteraeota bacterium]|nr:hypothetical protein [Candidatus Eremiobacteraeota bacterium]
MRPALNGPDDAEARAMQICDACKKTVGAAKFCPECGAPTALGARALDEARFASLADAIADSYAVDAPQTSWQDVARKAGPIVLLAVVLIVSAIAGALLTRQTQSQLAAQPLVTMAPRLAMRPRPTSAPTVAPTLAPTAAPTIARTIAPTAAPPSIAPSSPPTIHNAVRLVRSTGAVKVGSAGSCGGQDVTVDAPGYPRGCTVFDAASSGRLRNGRGTLLVVPVSTSEDASDVAYGLLYLQANADAGPRFVGMLAVKRAAHRALRVQDGLIAERGTEQTQYFTYDGRRIVRKAGIPRKEGGPSP